MVAKNVSLVAATEVDIAFERETRWSVSSD